MKYFMLLLLFSCATTKDLTCKKGMNCNKTATATKEELDRSNCPDPKTSSHPEGCISEFDKHVGPDVIPLIKSKTDKSVSF